MIAFIPFLIIGIIITAIGYILYSFFNKLQKLKDVDMSVPLPMMKESHAVSGQINATKLDATENISELYELMCVKEPVKYMGDPRIDKTIKDYKDLLHGKILDPNGKHVPSETIDGLFNADYVTYLKAQRKALKLAKVIAGRTWIDKELNRLNIIEDENDVRCQYIAEFQKMGISVLAIGALITDTKLNNFKATDWKKLAKKVKEYMDNYDELVVFRFLNNIDDITILLDKEKMDQFNTYISYEAPLEIALEIVLGNITDEQAVKAAKLVDVYSYSWSDAVVEVLEDDLKAVTKTELQDKYRSLVG